MRALDKLTVELGREPELEEAAQRLGWTVDAVRDVRAARHVVVSLDAPIGDSETRLGALIPAAAAPDDVDYDALAALLGSLAPEERRVLTLRFGLDGGDPQTRVGDGAAAAAGPHHRQAPRGVRGCTSCGPSRR